MVSKSEEKKSPSATTLKRDAVPSKHDQAVENKVPKVDDGKNGQAADALMNLGSEEELVRVIEGAKKDFAEVDQLIAAVDKEMMAKIKSIENEFHDKKSQHFKARGEIIASKYQNFWPMLFTNHPNIEIFLQLGAKEDAVQHADVEMCQLIRGLEVDVKNTDHTSSTSLTLIFDTANNPYFENKTLTRTVTKDDTKPATDESLYAGDIVKCTELKPKAKLLKLIDAYKKKVSGIKVEHFFDTTMIPFVVQFTDETNQLFNDFVENMKIINNNPIDDLNQALMNEDDGDLSSDSDEALESIEEEDESEESS